MTKEYEGIAIIGGDDNRLKTVGHYVGVNWQTGQLSLTPLPVSLEQFMYAKDIRDANDCLGPFPEKSVAKMIQFRVANFFRQYAREREEKGQKAMRNVTLMDLFNEGQI